MLDFNRIDRTTTSFASRATYDEGLRNYMLRVYNNMAMALTVTGFVAFLVANIPALAQLIFGTPLFVVAALAPLGYVIYFNLQIHKISSQKAFSHLMIFSTLMGVSLASVFLAYTAASVAKVFFITASVFGSMSFYGYATKKDLSGWGSFLMMGLIGIILASIVNIFLKSSGLDFAVSIIGVLIFTALTAYDTQRIKNIYYQLSGGGDELRKMAIMGALSLYLDFVNLMLMLLRFFGERR